MGSLVYVLPPSARVALSRTCVPTAIPGTATSSVDFAATFLRNVSWPLFTTYTLTGPVSLFVNRMMTEAEARGAVSTFTCRPPQATVTASNALASRTRIVPSRRWCKGWCINVDLSWAKFARHMRDGHLSRRLLKLHVTNHTPEMDSSRSREH